MQANRETQWDWITVTEAAQKCEVSRSLIRKWAEQGLIRRRQTSGHRRYFRHDVEDIRRAAELAPASSTSM